MEKIIMAFIMASAFYVNISGSILNTQNNPDTLIMALTKLNVDVNKNKNYQNILRIIEKRSKNSNFFYIKTSFEIISVNNTWIVHKINSNIVFTRHEIKILKRNFNKILSIANIELSSSVPDSAMLIFPISIHIKDDDG